MPYCEKCGFKLNDNAQFCPKCGTPVLEMLKTMHRFPASMPDILIKLLPMWGFVCLGRY